MSFWKNILHAFTGIFTSAAKELWNSLPQHQQDSLKSGSGIFKIISDNIDKVPEEIEAIIKTDYPNVQLDAIIDLAKHLNLIKDGVVKDAIAALQAWLKSKEGGFWDNAMNIAAQTLSFILSGGNAKPGIFAALMESVYRWFIKK